VQSQADRIKWFEKQLFGSKSEKRIIDNPQQFNLLTEPTATDVCSGLIAPDTLMRDNKRQPLRCQYESET
jgi:Transposase C of IS166 homeodomain